METLKGLADIARDLGLSRERVRQKVKAGTLELPPPDFIGPRKAHLWKVETLERWQEQRSQGF